MEFGCMLGKLRNYNTPWYDLWSVWNIFFFVLICRFLLYKVAIVLAGVSTALVPVLKSYTALIIYATLYGSSTGVSYTQSTLSSNENVLIW
jgi:hypothetical protein